MKTEKNTTLSQESDGTANDPNSSISGMTPVEWVQIHRGKPHWELGPLLPCLVEYLKNISVEERLKLEEEYQLRMEGVKSEFICEIQKVKYRNQKP